MGRLHSTGITARALLNMDKFEIWVASSGGPEDAVTVWRNNPFHWAVYADGIREGPFLYRALVIRLTAQGYEKL